MSSLRLITLALLCTLPLAALAQTPPSEPVTPTPPATVTTPAAPAEKAPTADLPLDEIRVFVEVFHKVKNDYVEEVTDKQLLEDAIKGMLAGLDPHSSYLDAEAYDELQQGTQGEFGGLGIEVGTEDGLIKVIAPIDDTPASRGGIQAGDTIIRIDDSPVRGMVLNDAVKKMRGKVGSSIKLTVVREGSAKPIEITLVRDVIKIKSVRSRILEAGFGYIRVSAFQGHTGEDLVSELDQLKAEAGGTIKGLILDLRNNPGGILGAAVAVSDAFLDAGKIVYTEGRVNEAKLQFDAKAPDMLNGAPLIVLVNEGSASASEIVAGALQDRQRAVIMGRQTFGKGSVQTILPMNNKAAIKITTARYFTPNGRSIQAEGIIPDIIIDKVKLEATEHAMDKAVTEAQLSRHLDNPTKEAGKVDAEKPAPPSAADLAKEDYEVYEALNMLKGMVLLHARSSAQPLN
jgi:carboxyl-terminal processing protease